MTSAASDTGPRPDPGGLRVLRFSHSAVVDSWRARERLLLRAGVDVTLATSAAWEEGGALVTYAPAGDDFVVPVRTIGRHPNLFVFDPRPLWRLLGEGAWDLIDMHEEPCSLAVAELLVLRWLRARHTPFLLYSAQNIDKRYPVPFRWLERWSLRGAAGAYVCNTEAGQILRRKGLTGELAYLPLGVDTGRFAPTERPAPSGRLRVGFVGRLIPHKGVDVLLRAVALDDRLDVDVYGAGPESDILVALADELGVAGRVTFHGFVDEGKLPSVFPRFDVLAVPSVAVPGWLEQFGRVAAEAQASGVPVVASASGALPEVVGDAGLLVPPGDPRALADALARVLDEPQLWERLRRVGLDTVDRFSWGSVVDGHYELYARTSRRA